MPGLPTRIFPDLAPVGDLLAEYPWPEGRWVRASMVSTADGSGVGPDGRSGSISTPADFALFVALRNDCDAIVVGAGTARAERYNAPRSARLVVVTRTGRLDPSLPFLAEARADALPVVLTCEAADTTALAALAGRADVIRCGDSGVDLAAGLEALDQRGLRRLVVEGGPSLLADIVAADLLDELDLQITPLLAGGSYPGAAQPARVLHGAALPQSPASLALQHVLTDGATLFLRYTRASAAHPTRDGE